MKRCRLSYDEWNCILAKVLHGCKVDSKLVTGYIGLVEIREVKKHKYGNSMGMISLFAIGV